jgi:hypothetical protein
MRNATTRVILVAAVALALAGCADGSEPDGQAPTQDNTGQDGVDQSQQRVEAALLTVEDLPEGWVLDLSGATSSSGMTTEPAECGVLLSPAHIQEPLAQAEAAFAAGPTGPFINQSVSAFDGDAAELLGQAVDAFDRCAEFSSTDPGGVTTAFRATPLSFPSLGDRTVAVRLEGSVGPIQLVVDRIMIAAGSNGVTLGAGGFAPLEADELESIVTTAFEKLNDVAG